MSCFAICCSWLRLGDEGGDGCDCSWFNLSTDYLRFGEFLLHSTSGDAGLLGIALEKGSEHLQSLAMTFYQLNQSLCQSSDNGRSCSRTGWDLK